jgi:TPR repeat protein
MRTCRAWLATLAFVVALIAAEAAPAAEGANLLAEGNAAYRQGYYENAFAAWSELWDQGFAVGAFNIGVMYESGRGMRLDRAEAARWYAKAVTKGYGEAEYRLARFYEDPDTARSAGLAADPQRSLELDRLAASHGNMDAAVEIGPRFETGSGGVIRDAALAESWYRTAAERGNPTGQFYLGSLYERGVGVPEDPVEAYKWYELALAASGPGRLYEQIRAARAALEPKLSAEERAEAGDRVDNW